MLKLWSKKKYDRTAQPPHWQEMLITLSLHALNHGVATRWYIDTEEQFSTKVLFTITLHAALCPALAHFIISYAPVKELHTLVIQQGMLTGVSPCFPKDIVTLDDAEYICKQYQCISIDALPETRTFNCVTPQRVWHDLSSHHVLALLKQLTTS